jgi:hypothetical protein
MFFTRTHKYHFPIPKEDLKKRLLGKHVKIHNLDFEVLEKGPLLQIIPHAEQIVAIKTLPITNVDLKDEGNGTKVTIKFSMRKFDSGGPMLVLIFSSFMLIAAAVLFMVKDAEPALPFTLAGISVFTLTVFSIRMQTGYFDYMRKIRAYIKGRATAKDVEANMPVM